jgi:hypothetical protein
VAGKTYTILYRDDVAAGTWQKLADVPDQGTTGEVEITDPGTGSVAARFYRLVTPQQF